MELNKLIKALEERADEFQEKAFRCWLKDDKFLMKLYRDESDATSKAIFIIKRMIEKGEIQ